MNRIKTSIVILFAVISLCFFSSAVTNKEYHLLSGILTETISYIKNEDTDQAYRSAEALYLQWESSRKHLAFFINSGSLESAGECVCMIQPMIYSDCDEALSQSKLFEQKLRQMVSNGLPFIYNIL